MQTEVTKKLLTVDEYHRMAEAGIFDPEVRLELIEGEIVKMSPPGMRHIARVNRATDFLITRLHGRAIVSVQNPFVLSQYTEPQPDIAVLKPRPDYYEKKRVSWEDAYLVIEVANSSLRYDRNRKLPLYAKAGVAEVWIENLQNNTILVYRDLIGDHYSTALTLHPGEPIAIAAFPDLSFEVTDFLG